MLQISKWKALLVCFICVMSIYLSIPSIFPHLLESPYARFLPSNKLNLGLDLRGGGYILLELDLKSYAKEQVQRNLDALRGQLKNSPFQVADFRSEESKIIFTSLNSENNKELKKKVINILGASHEVTITGNHVEINFDENFFKDMNKDLLTQTIEIVHRRLDETGTKELDIQRQGDNYIVVQVPGLKDPKEIKRLLGKTAKLSFHLVEDGVSVNDAMEGNLPLGTKLLPMGEKDQHTGFIVVQSRAILTGDMLDKSHATIDNGMPVVNFKFNNMGARIFGDVTSKSSGKRFAIVLDNKVISAPVINEPIMGGAGRISGNFTVETSNELALLLRAGALPVPLKIVEERTIGPSLGQDSIEKGTFAAAVGTLLVVIFMIIFYGLFGMFANIALIFNLFLMIAVLSLFGATLTLPGIAGMVLTLGMAVDANVLICERIREEVLKGRTPLSAIEAGYTLAYNTIFDSNFTTILVGVILYIFGSGAVKGFAVALSVGIICSMFTAVTVTKMMVALWYRRTLPKVLPL